MDYLRLLDFKRFINNEYVMYMYMYMVASQYSGRLFMDLWNGENIRGLFGNLVITVFMSYQKMSYVSVTDCVSSNETIKHNNELDVIRNLYRTWSSYSGWNTDFEIYVIIYMIILRFWGIRNSIFLFDTCDILNYH